MENLFKIRMSLFEPPREQESEKQSILGRLNGKGVLSYQRFDLKKHGTTLHKWSNKPYSAKFWDMAGSYEQFMAYYQQRMMAPGVQHTMFFLDGKPLAFSEAYPIIGSELEPHIQQATDLDYGIHFLMAPPRKIAEEFREFKRSISFFTLIQALGHLFKTAKAVNIYAEPDKENHKACHLARMAGLTYLRDVVLTDKTAALFHINKEDFKG